MITPQQSQPDLAHALGVPELWLKREDLHPYGSHKGRSIPHMIEAYAKAGIQHFVISSSGNAALAAAQALPPGASLTIYIGKNIPAEKLTALSQAAATNPHITIRQVGQPKQQAFQMKKNGDAKNLRQSTDDLALVGYQFLAEELNEIDNLEAIFIPTSSGTTAQAFGEWFARYNPKVQIHIVQTTACHPMAEEFQKTEATNSSIAMAIVDKIAHRKNAVVNVIKNSHGSGWIATDDEIQKARMLVKEKAGIEISPNSALSIAGLQKAIQNGEAFTGAVVCLITGK